MAVDANTNRHDTSQGIEGNNRTGCANRSNCQQKELGGRGAERGTDSKRRPVRHRGLEHVDPGDHWLFGRDQDKLDCDQRAAKVVVTPGHVAQFKSLGAVVVALLEGDAGVIHRAIRGMPVDDRRSRVRAVQVLRGEHGQHRHGSDGEKRRADAEEAHFQQGVEYTG